MSPCTIMPAASATVAAPSPEPALNSMQEVVEIGLLLPADWAAALFELSTKRQQTVAQLLRSFIGQGLVACERAV
jgi:hypothetical protein